MLERINESSGPGSGSRQDMLDEIAEQVDLQERAMQKHPPPTAAVYREYRDDLTPSIITDTERLLHHYMLSSSFISAWYHLAGDKAQRDKAAYSCSDLVGAAVDLDPTQVMRRHIELEQLWRRVMKSKGIAPRRFPIFWVIVLGAVVVAAVLFLRGT